MASVPFNNLITFSRGSNASVTGSNGLIQWAPNNLLTFSEQFNDAAWTKAGTTVSANTTAAPDGTTTADKQVEDTSTGDHRIFNNIAATVTASVTYTWSIYAKAAERTSVRVTNNSLIGATFNLTDGTFSDVSGGITAASTSVGNGWYRLAITGLAATSSERIAVYLVSGGATSYTGNGTSGIYIWGAQLELGSAATTYNSTTVKNLLGFSEAFDNAAWTKTRASIVTGAQANPVNGAFNAQKLMEDTTASATHPVSAGFTFTAIPYTMSIYAKAAGRNWIYLALLGTTNSFASFNLSNGTVGTIGAAATATIQDVGNGWYRCRITSTAAAGAGTVAFYPASADNTTSYTGDGNSGVYVYGAQLSDSASLDPYVPTPAAAPSSTAYYGPRFDYDPLTLAPKGLLVEEARTNLLTYSEQFDNVIWTLQRATITANATTAPDGTLTADRLVDNAVSGTHRVFETVSKAASALAYTGSIYLKAGTLGFATVRVAGTAEATYTSVGINLATGQLSALGTIGFTADSVSVTNAGNGWWRVQLVGTSDITTSISLLVGTATSLISASSYVGDGNGSIFVWGAQLEQASFATSYIPTVASTVTRSADIATINGSLFSQWYGQTAGAVVCVWLPSNVGGEVIAQISASTNTNRIQLINSSAQQASVTAGGVAQGSIDAGTINVSAVNKLAYGYQTNDTALSLNGGAVATDTTVTLPVVDRFCIGATVVPEAFLNGHIQTIDYIPARAADFQLQALTT